MLVVVDALDRDDWDVVAWEETKLDVGREAERA
jgi:hypothetical protein